MMRRALLWPMSAMLTLLPTTAFADDSRDCRDNNNHDLRIKACSLMIEGDPRSAIAYYNRGVSYQFKGDLDHAITDYNKAIELNPNFAPAYDNRAPGVLSKMVSARVR